MGYKFLNRKKRGFTGASVTKFIAKNLETAIIKKQKELQKEENTKYGKHSRTITFVEASFYFAKEGNK
jgi:hypothetical protein